MNQNIEKYRIRAEKIKTIGESPKAKGCLRKLHLKVIFVLEIVGFVRRRKSSSHYH